MRRLDGTSSRLVYRVVAVTFALFLVMAFSPARAAVDPTPCDGNICTGSIVVGGQTVNYAYTQHIRPNGTLKVRLNGGVYNQATLISHIIYGLPAFDGWNKYANPTNGAVFLPAEDINPAQTAYERLDADGCIGCIVDQVLTVTYSGLAEGAYTFDISIFQNGAGGAKNNLDFYVDAGAPSNGDESESWLAIPDMDEPCADGVDNDLSYYGDCLDAAACTGEIGEVGSGALCETPEATCSDGFDNDGDGDADCADASCDGRVGRVADGALCQYENEWGAATCGDNFDNDGDGLPDCVDNLSANPVGNPARACWKQPGYGCPATESSCSDGADNDKDSSFDSAWDSEPLTGRDCLDYDCAGNPACPSQEHRDASGADADLQCFNTLDDDLDTLFNCADPDCLGMDNGTLVCYGKEFDIVDRYQLCANAFDDDGTGGTDCADADCGGQFGNCGPCPAREDLTYDSCADGQDNDRGGGTDCADARCTAGGPGPDASLGDLVNAARCAVAETAAMCGDRFDNDRDGGADCLDAGCAGFSQCALSENAAPMCGDVYDNDGDGLMDCADPDCWGVGACAAMSWLPAACQIVPRLGPFTAFSSVDPTVTGAATVAARVNSTDTIRLIGAGNYSSVTIVIGDNTDPADYYPYAQPKTSGTPCQLAGTNSAKLDFIAVPGHVVQIYNLAGQTVNGFDLTFTCPTAAAPAPLRDYPISISVLKTPGDITEYGDRMFDYTLYEGTPPVVNDIEAEGESPAGTIRARRGEGRRFRAIAQDPGVGLDTSGICACTVNVDGADYPTADSECVTGPVQFFDDDVVPVTAFAEDGVNNIGASSPVQNFTVNVTPEVIDQLVAYPADGAIGSAPFFRTGKHTVALAQTVFMTAATDGFPAMNQCEVVIRNSGGAIMGGPGPTAVFTGFAVGNMLECENLSFDLTALPGWPYADGEYFVTVRAADDDGDYAESYRQVIYVCNSVPAAPGNEASVCSWADFDRDGATEGLFTTLYWGSFQICDNCVNLANPLQEDENANGVGEQCEPSSCGPPENHTGRCAVDRSVVCGYDSDDPMCPGSPWCCLDAGGPQECKCPWGLCLYGGQVCFDDPECKFCDNDPTVGCITDNDCVLAGVGGVCDGGGGWGTCAGDGTTACKRDTDCAAALPPVAGPCVGANICDNLMFPWLETVYGNVYSGKKIYSTEEPPATKFNATYCITAKSSILNFTSELCNQEANADVDYERPSQDNAYATVLGKIDVNGLLAGRYGEVTTVASGDLDAAITTRQNPLDGEVIAVVDGGDAVVGAHTFANAALDSRGKGTILIVGGDLYITGNMAYGPGTVTRLSQLASVGWIVLPAADGSKGNVYINQGVSDLVGAFFVGGEEGLYTVTPPVPVSEIQLKVYGLAIARKFHLNRGLRSVDVGAEQFIYDGRAVVNPPPGFEDIGKSLPVITDTP